MKTRLKRFFLIAKLRFHRKLDTFKPDVIPFFFGISDTLRQLGFFLLFDYLRLNYVIAVHCTMMCSAKFSSVNTSHFLQ